MRSLEQPCEPNLLASYPYRDADGALLFKVLRYDPKRFEIRGPRGKVLDSIPDECVLYRLPELLKSNRGDTVYVCEGEKDVDNLCERGVVATTNPGGTRHGWRSAFTDCLRDRHVVILPDADGPGKRHAAEVMDALVGVAHSAIVLELPRLHGRDDVSDWLERGNTIQTLQDLTAQARYAHVGLTRPPRGLEKVGLVLAAKLDSRTKLILIAMVHGSRNDGARKLDLMEMTGTALARQTSLHRVTAQRTITQLREVGVLRRDPVGTGHIISWEILAAIGSARPVPSA